MDQNTGDVQQDRERTRSAISEKIELLEECVRDRVAGAKTRVKQSFDIRYHVERRPWQMLGLSIIAGYFIGRMTANQAADALARDQRYWRHGETGFGDTTATAASLEEDVYAPPAARQKRSWGILDQFQDDFEALKGAAIGAVVSVVRDLLRSATTTVQDSAKSITNERRHSTEQARQI